MYIINTFLHIFILDTSSSVTKSNVSKNTFGHFDTTDPSVKISLTLEVIKTDFYVVKRTILFMNYFSSITTEVNLVFQLFLDQNLSGTNKKAY